MPVTIPGPWVQAPDQWSDWMDTSLAGSTTIRHTAPTQYSDDVYIDTISPGGPFPGTDSLAIAFEAMTVGPWIWVDPANDVYDINEILVVADTAPFTYWGVGAPTTYPLNALSFEWENGDATATVVGPGVQVAVLPHMMAADPTTGEWDNPTIPSYLQWTMRKISDPALVKRYDQYGCWMFTGAPSVNYPDGAWLPLATAAGLDEVATWGAGDSFTWHILDATLADFLSIDGFSILPYVILPSFALPGAPAVPVAADAEQLAMFSVQQGLTGWPNGEALFRVMVRPARYRFLFADVPDLAGGGDAANARFLPRGVHT